MGKISIQNYNLETNKQINKKICLLSDIHHNEKSTKKYYEKILNKINKIKPDFIVLAGDIIDNGKVVENEIFRRSIESFIVSLGSIARTIVTVGNHDLVYDYKDRSKKGNQLKWFESLSKYPNVYYIYNEKIVFNNIEFIHYSPTVEWYNSKQKDSFYDEFMRHPISIDTNDNYKILISHSPVSITKKSNYSRLTDIKNNINLILCGHMHNGAFPKWLEFLDFKHKGLGLISPAKKAFPIYCRGHHKIENMSVIISRGVKKVGKPKFLRFLNHFYSSEITLIDLN